MALHQNYTIISMACITFLYCILLLRGEAEAAFTDKDEVETLKIIAQKLGKGGWDFSVDPCTHCTGNSSVFQRQVFCDCHGTVWHIKNITLASLNLSGMIPPELSNLSHLELIDLTDNYLNGTIPPQLGSIYSLTNLSLSRNFLSGTIPKELGNLANLIQLSIHSNSLSGELPPELGNLKALQHLYLSSNRFTGEIPSAFEKLENLTEFSASSNGFTGKIPAALGKLSKLQILILQGTSLEGPIPGNFKDLNRLGDLRISDIAKGGSSWDFLLNLPNLEKLVLRNSFITGNIPSEIPNKLQTLDLSFNNLWGEIPYSLNKGEEEFLLFLGNNNLSGTLPPWLPDFNANARTFTDLSYNNFTGSISMELTDRIDETLTMNLIENFLSPINKSSPTCLQRSPSCRKQVPNCRLAINCGGPQLSARNRVFDADNLLLKPSSFQLNPTKKWGVSNIGYFIDAEFQSQTRYTATSHTPFNSAVDQHGNSSPVYPQLYNTARISPSSLRYYGLGLQNGQYRVELHFAEIQFLDTKPPKGVRIFDVYIQGKKVLKDFNIKEVAGEKNSVVIMNYTTNVTNHFLEIHFFWAGKGTCCEPQVGTYGPLVSAIIVEPEFKCHSPKNSTTIKIIIGIVGVTVTLGLLMTLTAIFINKKKKWDMIVSFVTRKKGFPELKKMGGNSFSLRVMKIATNNFHPKNKIGEGGFGAVYKGTLRDGRKVAIKQLSSVSKQGNREFLTEVSTISAVQHPNLVKLYGCCVEGEELLLVYEYMENGNLGRALFGSDEAMVKLDWPTRYRICIGVARGLAFLHEESPFRIVHRDIKAANILLDKDLNPKIADFGLARLFDEEGTHVSTRVAGTIGYLAPEYALKGHLSDKSDVYSFGVFVLEVVSGRTHTDLSLEEEKCYLLEWAWHLYENKEMLKLVESNLLQSEYNEEEVMRTIHAGVLCTHENPGRRPCMSAIIEMMEGRMEIPAPQIRPGCFNFWQTWELAAGVRHVQSQSLTTNSSIDKSSSMGSVNNVENFIGIDDSEYRPTF